MPRSRDVAPRKLPSQERSRAMVERIVDAGTRVLVAEGYDGASAHRIAREAGISPGSLYQYFPNKDAVVAAVVTRYGEQFEARIAGELTMMLDAPPEVLVPAALRVLVDAAAEQPEILRAVVEGVPLAAGRPLAALERRIGDLSRGYLMLHRDLLRDADLEVTVWMLVKIAETMTVSYVLDAPPISREQFVDELTGVVVRYLATPEAAARLDDWTRRPIAKRMREGTAARPRPAR